jgi:hypothetical protein
MNRTRRMVLRRTMGAGRAAGRRVAAAAPVLLGAAWARLNTGRMAATG